MTPIQQPRKKRSFFKRMVRYFKRFFILIGMLTTAISVLLFVTFHKVAPYIPPPLPDKVILSYTFKSGLAESVTMPSITQPFLRPETTFYEVTKALRQAAKDPRVKGFVARIQDINMAPAQIQELRDTITSFRNTGKFTYIFAENYGGFSSSMGSYYLATAFNQIWLQPVGSVSINGVAAEVPFLKGIMDKIGVEAQFARKGIYKSASESLTETKMSAPHREMMTDLINNIALQMVYDISKNRKIPADMVNQIINDSPYSDIKAVKLNLVDKTGYYNQMLNDAKLTAGNKDIKTVSLSKYFHQSDTFGQSGKMSGFIEKIFYKPAPIEVHKNKVKAKIALIFGIGDIISYSNQTHAGLKGFGMAADKIVAAFEEARNDKNVAAVVFRIDSPGGTPEAAESIRHAIIETQQMGKPVVVSMGGYAASGGYWISMAADRIFASEYTITGSIGIFVMFPTFQRSLDAIGISTDGVGSTFWAGEFRADREISDETRTMIQLLIEKGYDDFISKVAMHRGIDKSDVDTIAQGQVWSGGDAFENRLIDEIGGVDAAIASAAELAELEDGQYGTKRFEKELSPGERLVLAILGGAQWIGFNPESLASNRSSIERVANILEDAISPLLRLNDPKGVYLHCFCVFE